MPILTEEQLAKRPRRFRPWMLAVALMLVLPAAGIATLCVVASRDDGVGVHGWRVWTGLKGSRNHPGYQRYPEMEAWVVPGPGGWIIVVHYLTPDGRKPTWMYDG